MISKRRYSININSTILWRRIDLKVAFAPNYGNVAFARGYCDL